ncbi:DUF935 domain-containing protein [Paradevosia shaoguanensis]|uniref:DUF935 domain-containing protein n=1 Tax=Paradevosia shaoguanensis TaxID=1335043 RepID=A0AA41QSC0_9HYPH|nr:DUF935 domain-containing protein [Paradevosia shaoguanensis]MCF1744631.1 DUF935 domain-containing protein [Paradevosia shaoguanensis]MCI0129114.1 DUF935 domain-containing protein [Paradevosia shaoguanensis]
MAVYQGLIDKHGRQIEKRLLTTEIAGPTISGVRSPITNYPSEGLNPVRLANILKEADRGEPLRYLELAEQIEEKDPHYLGVLGTRRRQVSQLEITVEAASTDAEDEKDAEMVREWLKRDELTDELFNMLDAIGKGYSFTEIMWSTDLGTWTPEVLEWRDPRGFAFDRDGVTPLLIAEGGQHEPLLPYKFIHTIIRAKSGLPIRSGVARVATWSYMFKAFTNRDWAIFVQTFGQPIRIGKYGANPSQDDMTKLFSAVANIAGDCAAIIPESMKIEFVESKTISSSGDLYERRVDHLDRQVSKAVLGQTATTDAIAGGHAVGKEHRKVQEDIERADAKAMSAVLNRDLIRPWIWLRRGADHDRFPRLRIGRPDEKDVQQTVNGVEKLVKLGFKVKTQELYDLLQLSKPGDGDEVLGGVVEPPAPTPGLANPALQLAGATKPDPADALALDAALAAAQGNDEMFELMRDIIMGATSFEEVKREVAAISPTTPLTATSVALQQAMVIARLLGRQEILDGA